MRDALPLVLVAAALLLLPGPPSVVARLRSVWDAPRRRHRVPGRVPLPAFVRGRTTGMAAGTGALLGLLAKGLVVALAGAVTVGTVAWLVQRAVAVRHRRQERESLIEVLATLTAELRAGRTPAEALRVAAAVVTPPAAAEAGRCAPDGAPGSVADALLVAAATASVGGDVPGVLRSAAAALPGGLAAGLRRVAAGWQVSERSGASLATVLARMERDTRARAHHARLVAAELAGPRATGVLLAVLPVVGLLLGTVMGVDPLATLVHTSAGRLSLLAGIALDATGAVWTLRLLEKGDPP